MLAKIIDDLSRIEANKERNENETFVGAKNSSNDGFELQLNAAAAIELCRSVLSLINDGFDGKHIHFDNLNFVDEGNGKFTVIFVDNHPG